MLASGSPADVASLAPSDDRFCACGYNLRGLPASHACPECGTAAGPPVGRYLWDADVRWLRQLRVGVVLMLAHWFAYAPATVLFVPLANGYHPCMGLVWLFPQVVLFAGVSFLMTPEPGVRKDLRDLRRASLTRQLGLAWLGLTVLRTFVDVWYRYRHVVRVNVHTAQLDLVTATCAAAWTAPVMLHLSSIGRRVRSGWLAYGGPIIWALVAWGMVGDAVYKLLDRSHAFGWPSWEIRDSAGFSSSIGCFLTVCGLTAYWIALNLAIDGTDMQLKSANPLRRRANLSPRVE